jgi:hypothetical protein
MDDGALPELLSADSQTLTFDGVMLATVSPSKYGLMCSRTLVSTLR